MVDVVATTRGKYGGRIRERGEVFSLAKASDRGRWMVDAKSPEGKRIVREETPLGVTEAQIAAEEASATGSSSKADKAKIAAQAERIKELEAEVKLLKEQADGAGEPEEVEETEGAGETEEAGKPEEVEETKEAGEPVAPVRKTRRNRS